MSLAVVTDSAACLPPGLAQTHGIDIVDLHVVAEGSSQSTSRPTVDELTARYENALRRADEVLALHLSAALSGTVDNARLAAEQLGAGERLTVLDLGVGGGALGLAALAAADADDARHGAARARESASRSSLFFLVDDLSYLRRSGRVDRRTAMIGGALGIRPILRMQTDGIHLVDQARGAARARRRLVELAVMEAGGSPVPGGRRRARRPAWPVRLAVHYGDDPALGQALENNLASAMAEAGTVVASILRSPVDPASRVHLGPGALAVVVAPALGADPGNGVLMVD